MNNLIQWPRAQYWDKPWNPWIGNSVPVNTAKAMCEADLRQIAKEVKRK